ncbi:hypothetical protein CPB85DRAFT_1361874, partial [Mucidula mucida]
TLRLHFGECNRSPHARQLCITFVSGLVRSHFLKGHLQAVLQLSPHIRLAIKELSIYDLAVFWQPSFDRELGLLISCVPNLTHIYLQFQVTGFKSRRDLPDFLTATMRPALQQLQSVTFSDDDGHFPRNVIHMFKASEGSTVCKIEIRDCEGLFLSSTHLPLVIHSHCPTSPRSSSSEGV